MPLPVPRWPNMSFLLEGAGMNDKATVEWANTSAELARVWWRAMQNKSLVKLDEDDIRDFLIDLWIEKGGLGSEFEVSNRGQLYNYTLSHVGRSRDTLLHADSLSDICQSGGDGEFDEDRLGFLSYSDDGDVEADLDPADMLEKTELREELGDRLEDLAAIRDTGLSGALAEIFGITDRSGRTFAAEIRSEKILALIVDAARKRGMKPAEVKKLAMEIATERRKAIARVNQAGGDVSYAEIAAFEEMIGLSTTATTAKNRLPGAKRQRKPAQVVRKVPQQQSIPAQLELV